MIAIWPWSILVGLVELSCFAETAKALLIVFAVDVGESKHVVYDNEVLVEAGCVLGGECCERVEGLLIALDGIAKLFNVVVEFTECAVRDEVER